MQLQKNMVLYHTEFIENTKRCAIWLDMRYNKMMLAILQSKRHSLGGCFMIHQEEDTVTATKREKTASKCIKNLI